jgi:L-amino acid N-acyltransferase YncA
VRTKNLIYLILELKIRAFKKQDWASVSEIYAEGIVTGIATFETEVPSFDVWDEKFIKRCRLVAEINNEVVGFAVLSQVSKRDVYKGVAEVTVYIAKNQRRKGVGKQLLMTLQAGIFSTNKPSIQLHENCGFRIVGIREKIGQLHGIWYDNILMERRSKIIN